MADAHDPSSGPLDRPSEIPVDAVQGRPDPLSDVLRTVKLQGALFFLVDASDPWCVDVPAAQSFARIILPRARHVVSYHIVVDGTGLASVPGVQPVRFETGDIIVFPHADPYVIASAEGVAPELNAAETLQFFRDLAAGRLPFVIPEGGGGQPKAQFICGFLGCDLGPSNPLFSALPRLLHVRRSNNSGPDLLDRLVDLAIHEAHQDRLGGESLRLGLSELMFVEVLRRHLTSLSSDTPSWLAGLNDPVTGRALAILHKDPAAHWTVEKLAREAGTSRSVLAERFLARVGEPPMRYLAHWRMQLAAQLLTDGNDKTGAIADKIGFGSEAAFSRAFKRIMGMSPAAWRMSSSASE